MSGLIGKKIGMTSIFDEVGNNIPCTVIEAGPCVVTQIRTEQNDGYSAHQLGFDDKSEKKSSSCLFFVILFDLTFFVLLVSDLF